MDTTVKRKEPVQCKFWDFTLWTDDDLTVVLRKKLPRYATKYALKRERAATPAEGKTGLHYQGRVQLMGSHGKRHEGELRVLFAGTPLENAWWTRTSTNGSKTFLYILKAETTVEGPWDERDELVDPETFPSDVKNAIACGLRPYQKKISEIDLGYRGILWVYDVGGDTGKTTTRRVLKALGLAQFVPNFGDADKMMSFIARRKRSTRYIIDLPRITDMNKLKEVYRFLETLKDGTLSSWKWDGVDQDIERPQVVVLSNGLPDWKSMTRDRYTIVCITPDYDFCAYDPATHDDLVDDWKEKRKAEVQIPLYVAAPYVKKQRTQ